MAFVTTTYNDETELAAALTATVSTFNDEDKLSIGVAAATSPDFILAKGGKFTVVDDPQVVNVSLRVLAKGAKFTVILETA